ncbi:MAG: sulfatase-like hydrolase/transferase [Chitinivibrionales bacterium]|nr:sulfatase-like hydrolase/transferase [Chitinivibrionales bacterium]MBD3357993.1 sulfatase-like hydrolase/transferase [Chitinivibrionales bacterium]
MSTRFKGTIDLDIRNSKPDWSPYEAAKAPDGSPNILYIVWDDVGFGAFDFYGGPIEVPAMKRIADSGVRLTQFHTTALCSPTRSCLLTGRNATSNGMAGITEISSGFPGHSGRIPPENALISEVLAERGWSTCAIGKWHLTPEEETNATASKRLWPLGRGFDRFYGFLGGETDQWYPDLVADNHTQEPPCSPADGYHLSKDLADQAIRFVRDTNTIAPGKPWMLYYCPGAGHAPHQVPKEWADRYKGRFDMGYEKMRETILGRQKEMGLVPSTLALPDLNPNTDVTGPGGQSWPELDTVRPWDSLSEDEKRLFARMAEVYAGFVSYTDHQIGRLLDYLEQSNQLDNTIVVVVSDNGSSGEGGPNGSVNENKFFNGITDSIEENMKYLEVLGSEKTYNHYCTGWAMAFNTPFKMWKRYSGYEGGTADPCVIAWPKGIQARGEIHPQYTHATDIVPTLYDYLGIEPPDTVKGYAQSPIEGISFRNALEDGNAPTAKQAQFYSMLGTRGVWYKGWHANTRHPAISGWGHFEKDEWELYHLDTDRNQLCNVAQQYPEQLELMKSVWFAQAGRYNGFPIDDRTPVEIFSTERPQPTKPRDRYVYYPDTTAVPEAVAVNVRGRSYNIAARVTIDSPEPRGILFSHGGRFGGHALYINKDLKLCYVYNWLGEKLQKLVADEPLPAGDCILGVRFRLEGREGPSPKGMAALYINDKQAVESAIITQPGKFGLGSGLAVGRDIGQPVSDDYESPFPFRGGTIKLVTIDVSGEPYRDMEKELRGMLMRD